MSIHIGWNRRNPIFSPTVYTNPEKPLIIQSHGHWVFDYWVYVLSWVSINRLPCTNYTTRKTKKKVKNQTYISNFEMKYFLKKWHYFCKI